MTQETMPSSIAALVGSAILLAACGELPPPQALELLSVQDGFDSPESAVYDPASHSWFVSNIGGETGAKDGDGFISRLDEEGTVLERRCLTGLDGPAGLGLFDGRLFVADVDRLVEIDIAKATIHNVYAVPGAMLLNDVAVDSRGSVYVSDTFTSRVHVLRRKSASVSPLLQDPAFDHTNGLLVEGHTLYVACTGPFTDFEAEAGPFRVDLRSLEVTPVPGVRGQFDAVVDVGGAVLLSDFRGSILAIDAPAPRLLRDLTSGGLQSAADFGFSAERDRILVPDLFGGRVAGARQRIQSQEAVEVDGA